MFLLSTAGILAAIVCLGLISVSFLCEGEKKRRLYRIILLLDSLMIIIIFGGFIVRNHVSNTTVGILGSFATVFLLTQLICGGLVVLALIIRSIYRIIRKPTPYSSERRRALKYGLFYPVMALAAAIYGNRIERLQIVDRFFNIPVHKLPPELNGFTIAQISDVHLGAYFSLNRLNRLLERISVAKPDILVITGDIFDDVNLNDEAIKLVDSYCDKFKHGIYYCHGNHEHFRGIQHIESELAKTKIHWLVNQSANVKDSLYICGVDYPPAAPIMKSKPTKFFTAK